MDIRLHLGLEPEVESSLNGNYSVTQSPPVDYYYVKWWDGGPIPRASTKKARTKVKYMSDAERRNSRVLTVPRILGTLGTLTRPSYVFLRVWPSPVRVSPKYWAQPLLLLS